MSRKSIFNRVNEAYDLLDKKGGSDVDIRLEVLDALKDFVYAGNYTKYRSKGSLLDYERIGTKTKLIAQNMNMTAEAVRLARKRVSDDLYAVLGEDVIERIVSGAISECLSVRQSIEVYDYAYTTYDFLLEETMDCLDNAYIGDGKEEFELTDCMDELAFLSMFTLVRLDWIVDKLDTDKLNYIIRLVKGRGSYPEGNRLKVLKYITSVKSIRDSNILIRKFIDKMISGSTKYDIE